jgi:trimethylamine--corrinoid protein Co-methyltransferase
VKVGDPKIQNLMRQRGCTGIGGRMSLSPAFVEDAIKRVRPSLVFLSTTGDRRTLENGRLLCHSTGGTPWTIDLKTGKRKEAATSDLIDCIRLMNRQEGLDFPCALLYPLDMLPEASQTLQTAALFRHSVKPVYCPGVSTPGNARYIAEIFKLFGSGKKGESFPGIVGLSPESPLFWPKDITDSAAILAESGIPMSILAAPMAGMTAPLSVAGCVTMCHAEILAFTAFCDMISPGTPIIYGARSFFADMHNMRVAAGLPETGIASAMASRLAAFCGMISDVYGMSSTSGDFDEQTGYEKMLNGLLPAMAGANMITGYGSMSSVMCGSLEQIVIDDEIVLMIKKAAHGVRIDDDAIGFEAVSDAIGKDGDFLSQSHTVEFLKNGEMFLPRVGASPGEENKASLKERAKERVIKILSEKREPILSYDMEYELRKIETAAKKELAGIGF